MTELGLDAITQSLLPKPTRAIQDGLLDLLSPKFALLWVLISC